MAEEKTLTPAQAMQFYDRMGARQDWNRFYEQAAIDRMIEQGDFANAHRVVEFGCGTGRIAERLLARHLPSDATYVGLDLSATMVNLATERVAQFGRRAQIIKTDGSMTLDLGSESADRFFSNYVFDLLSREDIAALVAEAHRVLAAEGLLGAVSLTHGRSTVTKMFSAGWLSLWKFEPSLLGGCRPIELLEFIPHSDWRILHMDIVRSLALSSEVVIAAKR
jgi:ubiquinone/menaquinone biosynthesis C-methylase UbiE